MIDSVTIEEAVARLINLDYVPTGFSVIDMTSAFLEEATVQYENARIDGLPHNELLRLKRRMDVCSNRHELGVELIDSIGLELRKRDKSALVLAGDSSVVSRITLASLNDWATDRFGISVSNIQSEYVNEERPGTEPQLGVGAVPSDAKWDDIVVKIYSDYKIGWRSEQGKLNRSSFHKIKLMGTRKMGPNALGLLLVGMSMGKRFPSGTNPQPKDKTSISKLRDSLRMLTGLSGDPFLAFNEGDGWRPRFKLVDDRRNADERAKQKAVHEPLDPEAPDFEDEDDEAGRFIAGKD